MRCMSAGFIYVFISISYEAFVGDIFVNEDTAALSSNTGGGIGQSLMMDNVNPNRLSVEASVENIPKGEKENVDRNSDQCKCQDQIDRQQERISKHEEQNSKQEEKIGKLEEQLSNQDDQIRDLKQEQTTMAKTITKLTSMEEVLRDMILTVSNPCNADPCGPNSVCRNSGGVAFCLCLSTTKTTTTTKATTKTATTPSTPQKDLLYLGNSLTVELPSFSTVTSCCVHRYPEPFLSAAVSAIVGGQVMVCGGHVGDGDPLSSCHSLVGGVWTRQPNMKEARDQAAATTTEKGFLITGGFDGSSTRLSSTEYFSSGVWKFGPALPEPISGHCQLTVGSAVYIIGGYGSGILASVYKLESGVWTRLLDLKHRRWQHSCVRMGGEIFVIGGYRAYKSVEVLNISSQTWREGPSLPADHYDGQAIVYQSVLYVLNMDGKVMKLTKGGEWEYVARLGDIGSRPVNPAPLMIPGMLGC